MMPTASSSIFSKRSETIHYCSSNIASIFSTAGNYTKRGRTSWQWTSKDLMWTVSKQQYGPPTRSPHLSQVIPLEDGLLIVVGPEEVLTVGQPSTIKSATSAIGSDASTSTI